ncbi:MAG: hypothetical protein QF577_06660 [Phycisphaerae bacterium]|nr:hypothetical protein [Phycisphaerae bacterium]MDP7637211.1 hypothetical protein [Phycisphaerae bacterium]
MDRLGDAAVGAGFDGLDDFSVVVGLGQQDYVDIIAVLSGSQPACWSDAQAGYDQ